MKIAALIQARMNSTRLPGKVMKKINSYPIIELIIERLKFSKKIDEIILATTKNEEDDYLSKHASSLGVKVFRGSEKNVLDRFYKAAKENNLDCIVRITADCPLVDPWLVDQIINEFLNSDYDYISNALEPTYPDGLDCEVFSMKALEKSWKEAISQHQKEHVTPYIYETDNFRIKNFSSKKDFSNLRWTVDENIDLLVIKNIYTYFSPRIDFNWEDVIDLYNKNPDLFKDNLNIKRNEGLSMSTGQKLWKRALKVIPGGNMLLSKRPDMFLPDNWPTYYSKAKGCKVWDMDGKEYIDMSIMGIGTNILGYANEEIDNYVCENIQNGNMSTLNCSEEVLLAEKLVEAHPWSDMAKFARSGGEANSIAIRIARAASGKDKVAMCGYHGWHDWYLAANINDTSNLDGHHLEGLKPLGVPKSLKETVFPFQYNNIDSLLKILKNHDIGVIKMEVSRSEPPKDDFLNKVREISNKNNIILIFDECTSGFRKTFGGLHKFYDVEPDMAMFGKAMGNGYAITAVIGKEEIMNHAQSTFISSTFWTERAGPSAALKTLEIMKREKSWEVITQTGSKIKKNLDLLSKKYELPLQQFGLEALSGFNFDSTNNLAYKTFISQEMLKKGFLAGNLIYVCTHHTKDIIEEYFSSLDPVLKLIKDCEEGKDINKLLDGPICSSGFQRLN